MILKILNQTVLKILSRKINPKIKFKLHSWLVRADYGTILCQVEHLFNLAYFFPVFSISSENINLKINFKVSALTEQTAEKSIQGQVEYYIDPAHFFSYFQSALRSETKPHFYLYFHLALSDPYPPPPDPKSKGVGFDTVETRIKDMTHTPTHLPRLAALAYPCTHTHPYASASAYA